MENEENVSRDESSLVNGLVAFHAVSPDLSQRYCHYETYHYQPSSTIAADAKAWFDASMRISEVNEKWDLIVQIVAKFKS